MKESKKYLSVEAKYAIRDGREGEVIFLTAPVGSGKTTFIIHELWRFARTLGLMVLLVVNRSALRGQVRKDIYREIGMEGIPEAEESKIEVEGLTVISYQYLQTRIGSATPTGDLHIGAHAARDFRYVIFDEIHYLFSDSLFNKETYSLRYLPTAFSAATRVYMSATLAPVRDCILNLENIVDLYEGRDSTDRALLSCRYVDSRRVQNSLMADVPEGKSRRCNEPEGPEPDFSYFRPVVFDEKDDLCKRVLDRIASGDTGKWLIFINNKKEAEEMRSNFEEKGLDVAFISADIKKVKDLQAKESILKKQKFSEQILLTTSVIDNGVSIIDPKLTHLVVDGDELISVMQQAGRIRVKNNRRKIELWLCRYSSKHYSSGKYSVEEKLKFIEKWERTTCSEEKTALLLERGNDGAEFLFGSARGPWQVNPIAKQALEYRKEQYEKFHRLAKDDPNGPVKEMLSWFGLQEEERMDLKVESAESAKAEFVEFCRNSDKDMSEEAWKVWAEEFKKLYELIAGAHCKDHPERKYGIQVINTCMKETGVGLKAVRDSKHKVFRLEEV